MDGDWNARERLVVAYAPLVKHVADVMSSALPAHVEKADLVSFGLLGLIQAIDRFEPASGVLFEAYASPRIERSIIGELGRFDWVPRSVQARAGQIERAIAKLERQLDRAPTDHELADELAMTVDEFEESLIRIGNSALWALLDLWSVQPSRSGSEIDVTDMKQRLAAGITRLPEREKLFMRLYYIERLTVPETARVLALTEAQASQLQVKAILRLRARLA